MRRQSREISGLERDAYRAESGIESAGLESVAPIFEVQQSIRELAINHLEEIERLRRLVEQSRKLLTTNLDDAQTHLAVSLTDGLEGLLERALRQVSPPPRPLAGPWKSEVWQKPRLIIADEDAGARQALAEALADEFEVSQVNDGSAALKEARAHRAELLLMDLSMPRLDGLEALRRLRRDARTAQLPVILIAAQADDDQKVRALNLGAADVLVKPLSFPELKARLAATLRATEQRAELLALAETDGLTGLPNFRAFQARLGEEEKRARRYGQALSLVMMDLDKLKGINDQYGHDEGNQALIALARVIERELRASDFAARFGGDEFVVLLPHTGATQARRFAERVRSALHRLGDRVERPLRVSVGVAAIEPGEVVAAAQSLLQHADAALYAAKRGGRDQVAVAAPAKASEA
jgi:diguanylate cyclase (GGDEF)-like protein